MARKKSGAYSDESREFLGQEIRHHVKDQGMPQDQAVAAAMSEARRSGKKVPRRGRTAGTRARRATPGKTRRTPRRTTTRGRGARKATRRSPARKGSRARKGTRQAPRRR